VIPIRWTNGAADQLEAIVKRIREDNAEAARTVVQTVLDRIGILEAFPSLGRPGEVEDIRELIAGFYVIVYRLTSGVAETLHIWHGAQDWR
jgi:toxin ParE1/3/4